MPSLFSRLLLSLLVPLYQISFGIDNRATARELLEVNIVPKTLHIKSQKWWLKKFAKCLHEKNCNFNVSAKEFLKGSLFVLEPCVINE